VAVSNGSVIDIAADASRELRRGATILVYAAVAVSCLLVNWQGTVFISPIIFEWNITSRT